jgi:NTE family protein
MGPKAGHPAEELFEAEASRTPEPAVALCLSGGGYRAMVFHLGALWRLNEAGLLRSLKRVSSVSGGSITAATLAVRWPELNFDSGGVARAFLAVVVEPVRELARQTIDVGSVFGGILNPFSTVADNVAAAYRKYLFGGKTLQDLPDEPRFVINATNVQTAALWRFSKPYMGDYRVGLVKAPAVDLATAVGASSAFPPFLSPVHLRVRAEDFTPDPRADLQEPPFTTNVVLSDGGVYDNLGLETAFKRYVTLLVGDGGAKIPPEPEPHGDWARHSYRVLDIVDNQVRSLRKRLLLAAYQDSSGNPVSCRKGTYWGIRTDIIDYGLADALTTQCPHDRTLQLAAVPTRLQRLPDDLQERLINWGYAVCDAALRRHLDAALQNRPGIALKPPAGLPYPETAV